MRLRIALEILLVLVAAILFWAADRPRSYERAARMVVTTPHESQPRRDSYARPAPEQAKEAEAKKEPRSAPVVEDPVPGHSRKEPTANAARRWSRWDPPANLDHLESTPQWERNKIDELVDVMFDVDGGRESLDAKEALVAIGKPAFPRVLGAMAEIRDTITDEDNATERLTESSLKLADHALREMDGYLTAKGKSTLRPGSEKRYITYICRLHYKRWLQVLKDMPELPGPYDPTLEYK